MNLDYRHAETTTRTCPTIGTYLIAWRLVKVVQRRPLPPARSSDDAGQIPIVVEAGQCLSGQVPQRPESATHSDTHPCGRRQGIAL